MLKASIWLFVLAILVPNLILLLARPRPALRGHLPNLSFALVLGSFVLGLAWLLQSTAHWSLGVVLYLAFEAACLVSTLLLFQMKEAQKARLLRDAQTRAGGAEEAAKTGSGIEVKDATPGHCVPSILSDTGTADGDTGWTVSSLFSWHVYVYRLQVRFSVQPGALSVTAEAETYDANWYELYLAGIGLLLPGAQLLALIAGASIKHSHYHASQTANGLATCLPVEGGCVLIPNADPALAGTRHNEVSAAALIVATRLSPAAVQFQLSGVASMSGHNTVQGITGGASLGGSTPVPGPLVNPTSGGPIPITLTPGINLGVTIVPSPTAVQNLPLGRSAIVLCKPGGTVS
ncbi:MAG: hypothetical protein AB7R90_19840 [Reyranellaceae bacterium]